MSDGKLTSSQGSLFEYRVTWQREGQAKKNRYYQTEKAAQGCAERQRSAREEMDWLPVPLPEICFGPIIERRAVGPWQDKALLCDYNAWISA